jgi:predicted DNA binding protein
MSVIVTLSLPPSEFELGRVLDIEGTAVMSLESIVPLGEQSIPFLRVRGGQESFEASARAHSSVNDIRLVNTHDGEALYALDWDISEGDFVGGIVTMDGYLLEATGTASEWSFDIRFRTHEKLAEFQEYCVERSIPIDIQRIYNPTKPDAGPWYGLTAPQRETLARAVQMGYYDIPREVSTKELAAEFDLSDQAVTERLRRGIASLVTNTVMVTDSETGALDDVDER